MAETLSLEEASSHLPELLSRLAADTAEIIIASKGTPIARLLPANELNTRPTSRRVPGGDRGRFVVPPEFFDPLPEDSR